MPNAFRNWRSSLIIIPCLLMFELLREKAISPRDMALFTPVAIAYLGFVSKDGKTCDNCDPKPK